MIPFVDVLGLYMIQDITVLRYIHTSKSLVPSADVLRICKFQHNFMLDTYIKKPDYICGYGGDV
jgi:hypothetical protein